MCWLLWTIAPIRSCGSRLGCCWWRSRCANWWLQSASRYGSPMWTDHRCVPPGVRRSWKPRAPLASPIRRCVVGAGAAPHAASSSRTVWMICPPPPPPRRARWPPSARRPMRGWPARCAPMGPQPSFGCSARTASAAGPTPVRAKRPGWRSSFWTCAALPRAPMGSCPMMWCSCSTAFLTRSCRPSSQRVGQWTNIWAMV
mmetsp:Transcript_29252/g.56680  ORF Transcript_29252/g.56680 Transcript_29252/m.56680 type:complete len:200 (-) Transcript_29252:474-1073(-)